MKKVYTDSGKTFPNEVETMEIKARISNEFEKIELHVCNHAMTDEVKGILSELHEIYDLQLTATDSKGDRVLLRPGDVVYFSASGQKVFAGIGPND